MTIDHEQLTGPIIGAAIEVHRELGPGFLESVYEQALAVELRRRSIPFVRQHPVPILYQGVEVGFHRLDLFALDQLVVELKAVKELSPEHYAVVRSYLRACKRELGLLLNFAKVKLDSSACTRGRPPTRDGSPDSCRLPERHGKCLRHAL